MIMNGLFKYFQNGYIAAILAIVLGAAVPLYTVFGLGYLLVSTPASIAVFLLCSYFFKTKQFGIEENPGHLATITGASLGGSIYSVSLLLALLEQLTRREWEFYTIFAFFVWSTGICIGMLWHFGFTKRKRIVNSPG